MSPELNSTVLGHVYRLCLTGEFDKATLGNALTLAEAKKQINEKVSLWVRNRYFAFQHPQWIDSDRTRRSENSLSLISLLNPSKPTLPKPERLSFTSDVWNKLSKLRAPYRFAPIELGMVEAQLVQLLEQIEARGNLTAIQGKLNDAFNKLERAIPQTHQISLIEDRLIRRYTRTDIATENEFESLYKQWRTSPPWVPSRTQAQALASQQQLRLVQMLLKRPEHLKLPKMRRQVQTRTPPHRQASVTN